MESRPQSLAEVAQRVLLSKDGQDCFGGQFKDFLHEFNKMSSQDQKNALARCPPSLNEWRKDIGKVYDVYLAAAAIELARASHMEAPGWSMPRRLDHPWFALPGKFIRNILIMESPPAFRERNLFVSENALSVA
ncbi:MAG: hypothetical protein PHV34_03985 [Verrucomicrobiae bacterium]|nr:hypothetical protein [Verrucomicrobiae bacterium]